MIHLMNEILMRFQLLVNYINYTTNYEGVRQYLFVKFSFHIYKIKLSIIVNSGDMI